jgi:hypothetical protein|tara:strand:+ start:612 stop:1067 length:456 start_codon:yes stop_codon:yes gene_type:complete
MEKFSFFHFLKYFVIILLTYNIFSLSVLYIPNKNLKNNLWKWTPFNYQQGVNYPNYLSKMPLLNKNNRILLSNFLNKNIYKDFLDINYWYYKQTIESIDRDNIKELEKSFYKAFVLSKNNQKINLRLRNYFIKNNVVFSREYKIKTLKGFF